MIAKNVSAWTERAEIARKQGQSQLVEVAMRIASMYQELESSNGAEPDYLRKANILRKRIEATEQHRTMSVEHGLSDEAIDATHEIQELERQLIELIAPL